MTSSPNHDERRDEIRFIILHYTGMETGEAARDRLCDPDAKVSAHYLVWEDGRVELLVPEHLRAWHAGVGEWRGVTDINSASIGIEIVNGGHDFGLPEFPEPQIEAVVRLVGDILERHGLTPEAVIGHSDLAPARKQDPGEKFPWRELAEQGVSIWVDADEADTSVVAGPGDGGREVSVAQVALAEIGYAQEVTGRLDEATRLTLAAFQRRFRPERVDGQLDIQTLARLAALAKHLRARADVST